MYEIVSSLGVVCMNSYPPHLGLLSAMFVSFWKNRQLIWQMTRRDIAARYRGSIIGLTWSFLNPLLTLLVYTFVFSVVLNARFGLTDNENRVDFALLLFVGLIVFNLFSECVNRAPGLIVSHVSYVKKVMFPLEILPWVTLGSVLFHSLVSLFVLLLAQLFFNHTLHWTSVLFPLVLVPLIFTSLGFSWFLAALGVFVRDIGQVTGVFTMMLMFLSAIFYPVSALPEAYQGWLQLNPLVFMINESRKVLILGGLPDWLFLGISLMGSIVIAAAGFWWFQKVRKGFADVL